MATGALAYNKVAAQSKRDELILAHLSLVRHLVGKMAAQLPSGVDLENLEAAGVLGLVEAATHFDPERGNQFKTYAYLRVRGAILDELRRNCPLPQHMLELVAKVRNAHKQLEPPVTVEALARATGLNEEQVADALAAFRMTHMISLEKSAGTVGTRLDDRQERPDVYAERAELSQLLTEAIESLPPRERLIVTLYYKEDLRLKEIGQLMELSESRVSRMLNTALFEIGEYMRAREVEGCAI